MLYVQIIMAGIVKGADKIIYPVSNFGKLAQIFILGVLKNLILRILYHYGWYLPLKNYRFVLVIKISPTSI